MMETETAEAEQTPEVEVLLLPKQEAFLRATEREVLLSGSFGAGKSQALCRKVVDHAQIEGNLVLLGRKTRTDLRQTTLRTLFEEVLIPNSYVHHKSESVIQLNGGGEIYYFGFDDPVKIASINAGAIAIDQAEEMEEDDYMMALGRLRRPADPNHQLFCVCNPANPSHFLHERFFNNGHNTDRKLILTNSLDNVFLPKAYQDLLQSFVGQYRDRYVLGKWVAFEGLCYPMFDRNIHVREREGPWRQRIVCVDQGFDHPFVALELGIDGDGRPHILREFSESGLLPERKLEILKSIAADVYVVDPSAAELIASMQNIGLTTVAADNSVLDGIERVQKRWAVDAEGRPRMTISSFCTKTIKGSESYHWKDKTQKDQPVKKGDDEMDALRYGISYLDAGDRRPIMVTADDYREPEKPKAEQQQDRYADRNVLDGEEGEDEEHEEPDVWNNPAAWSRV